MSKPSFADVMASDKNGRRRTSTFVCLSPDLSDLYSDLEARLNAALDSESAPPATDGAVNTKRRLSGNVGDSSDDLKTQMADLIRDNPESFYEVHFEQQRRHDWLQLRSAHAPRDDKPEDAGLFNAETFPPAAIELCLVDPEPTAEVMAYFEEIFSAGEWDRLATLVWFLNEGTRSVPKEARG